MTAGSAAGAASSARARAVRFGALMMQRELAARAGDSAAAARAGAAAAVLLDAQPGAAAIARFYAAESTTRAALGAAASADERRDAWRSSLTLLGADDVRAGVWLAAVRDAVRRRDVALLRSGPSRREARALGERLGSADDAARAAAERLARAAAGNGPFAWDALGRDVELLLATLGR